MRVQPNSILGFMMFSSPLNAIISLSPYSPSIILYNNMFSETPFHKQREQAAETSLLLISCHITSKTAPAKWAESGDGFNWKHPHLLHPSKINEAKALWRHTGKFNPHSGFGDNQTRDFETRSKLLVGNGSLAEFDAPSTESGPTPLPTSHETFKSKKFKGYLPLEPKIMQGNQ